jgi:hypothetical protein
VLPSFGPVVTKASMQFRVIDLTIIPVPLANSPAIFLIKKKI